jgi:hypothetical protein
MNIGHRIAFKTDPCGFLGTRSVWISGPGPDSGAVLKEFKYIGESTLLPTKVLRPFACYHKWDLALNDDSLSVKNSPTGTDGSGTYLPWSENTAYAVQPYESSEYMFTAPMDGCCVIVCGKPEAPYLVHANFSPNSDNYQSGDGYEHWIRRRERVYLGWCASIAEKLSEKTDPPPVMFSPLFYRKVMGRTARVFGLKSGKSWAFFYNITKSSGESKTQRLYPFFDMMLDEDESFGPSRTTVGSVPFEVDGYRLDGGRRR